MHTMWKGSISFGLVNIPIKMHTATEDKDVKFRYLHKGCNTPLKYERVCPKCDKKVEWEEIVRGYEYEPGRFVLLEDNEIEELKKEFNKLIEITDFVDLADIDPIYFNRSYYLSPGDNGNKAYNLLYKALLETGRIGVAKITIRSKQSLAVIRGYNNLLILETMFFPDELRAAEQVPNIKANVEVVDKELDMAKQLIDNLTVAFEPEKYQDEYRLAVKEMINSKIQGKQIHVAPEEPRANVVDIMDALKASVERTQKEDNTATGKQKSKKKKSS